MKHFFTILFSMMALMRRTIGHSQDFVNLNFESANVSGYAPGNSISIADAFLGWAGYFVSGTMTNLATQVVFDGISLGGEVISVVDTNAGFGFNPIQGKYSAFLFGGAGTGALLYSATISQTGLVPDGTESIQLEAQSYGFPFVVMLGGQTINMAVLQTFANYTLYGGNIPSSLAGVEELLSITEPAPTGTPPSFLELDDIQFSSSPAPEPGDFALAALGASLLGLCRWKSFSK